MSVAGDPPAEGGASTACVILCGGLGTRLAGAVGDRPKALAPVAGRPFLAWLLADLRRHGVRKVVLATGHRGEMIESAFGDGTGSGLRLRHSREPTGLGTAGAVRLALAQTAGDPVIAINGDSYCGADPRALVAEHRRRGARATVAVVHAADAGRYGSVTTDDEGWVTAFVEKGTGAAGLVSAGVYVIDRDVLDVLPPGRALSLENDVFPGMIAAGLAAVAVPGPFVDIGTPESYRSAAVVMRELIDSETRSAPDAQAATARRHLRRSIDLAQRVLDQCVPDVVRAAEEIARAFGDGGKLLLCGNGGSAADAQHVAAEFVSRLRKEVERAALPAVALTTDTSFITAYANDYQWDGVFARQVEALGRSGDVLVAISTSGRSANVVRAVEAAAARQMRTVALLGEGGVLSSMCDVAVVIPSTDTGAIQEALLAVEHTICELVEDHLFGAPPRGNGDG